MYLNVDLSKGVFFNYLNKTFKSLPHDHCKINLDISKIEVVLVSLKHANKGCFDCNHNILSHQMSRRNNFC